MPRRHGDGTTVDPVLRRFTALRDATIGATDGDIGTVEDVYFDDLSWTVRYLVVDTGTWLSDRKVLLSPASLREFSPEGLYASAWAVTGFGIRATDGELGHVEDFLIDDQDWAIRFLIVDPRRWWPGPHVLLGTERIRGVTWNDSTIDADVTRETVRNAPRPDAWTASPPAA